MCDFCDEMLRISGGKKLYKQKTNVEFQEENKRLREAINYLLGASGPMTSQQEECWPVLEEAMKAKK